MTTGAAKALDDIARRGRLLHQLFWCTIVNRYSNLLSPTGFSYLRSTKIISQDEYEALIQVDDNGLSAWPAAMLWWVSTISKAVKRGDIEADVATMTAVYGKSFDICSLLLLSPKDASNQQYPDRSLFSLLSHLLPYKIDQITSMRGEFASMGDMYDGRMPLAYIHFVNLLVDVLVFISPIALYSQYWMWSIIGVGIVTLFYKGIVNLSMMFLDPVDNDEVHHSNVSGQTVGFDVGVFIQESNTGSISWKGAAMVAPKYD